MYDRIVRLLDRVEARFERIVRFGRQYSPPLDYLWRAGERFLELGMPRFAAAAAYYGFFAILAIVVLGFSILSAIFQDNALVVEAVTEYLQTNLPQLQTQQLIDNGKSLGFVASITLLFAGVAWVNNLRASQRALWRLDQQPGNVISRWLVDCGVLVALAVLMATSVSVFTGLQVFLVDLVSESRGAVVKEALRGLFFVLSSAVDLVLGAFLLAAVPRLRMSARRLLVPAGLFAVGFWLLKTLGTYYISRTEHNPAYQVAAGAVGLLVFMYLLHQIVLFAAAMAATGEHGEVRDLGERRDLTP